MTDLLAIQIARQERARTMLRASEGLVAEAALARKASELALKDMSITTAQACHIRDEQHEIARKLDMQSYLLREAAIRLLLAR